MKNQKISFPFTAISTLLSVATQTSYAFDLNPTSPHVGPSAGTLEPANIAFKREKLGFNPKTALRTLNELAKAGSEGFNEEGVIAIPQESLKPILMATAADELRIEIVDQNESQSQLMIRIRERSHRIPVLTQDQAHSFQELARQLKVMCDMSDAIIR